MMKATQLLLLIFALLPLCFANESSKYIVGEQGQSCFEACQNAGLNCNPNIITNDTTTLFTQLGVKCTGDGSTWGDLYQPAYISGSGDPNYGKCIGYVGLPAGIHCGGSLPTAERLCKCDEPTNQKTLFGNGFSAGGVGATEQYMFQHVLAPGDYGVMTHFWFTVGNPGTDNLIIRYYVDGETTASIAFNPALAAGVGFSDTSAPWGSDLIGKGAHDGSYFLNFKVPFQKSIQITAQHTPGNIGGFYMIVRGGTNVPINVGSNVIPTTARLALWTINQTYQPLDFVNLAQVESGAGLVFMHTLVATSGNMNFLEGCYHWFTPDNTDFPGVVLSTGTEDYFDSGWYFNAGQFHLPTAGFTHFDDTNGTHLSAYRIHEKDALTFSNGFLFQWRNGDTVDAHGIKCFTNDSKARTVGSPTVSQIISYVWGYTW